MKLPSYFNDFLKDIRLTKNQVDDLLSSIIVSTFLQGSYRRSTAVRPKSDQRSDVDVIVVTKLDKDEYTPEEAMKVFEPFMEKYYKGKYRFQGRSIGIELSYVDLDVVVTSAPSEAESGILENESVETDSTIEDLEAMVKSLSANQYSSEIRGFLEFASNKPEWKTSPLHIPDRSVEEWKETHPLEQIRWTWNKNASCNGHYINVVKALKWWKRVNDPDNHPKSYPFEHLIGQNCPDGISSIAEGVTLSLESIAANYPDKPFLSDHGVQDHDVFARITDEEYEAFYINVQTAAGIARQALDAINVKDSAIKWRELFGSKFPPPSETSNTENNSSNGFSSRTEESNPGGGRFA
jgi:predicted nucleotidyltransferase